MNSSKEKPYIILVAEIIYLNISLIKNKHPHINTKDAINKFFETETFKKLNSGDLHNQWFNELKENDYTDINTGKKIPKETLKLLELQRDIMIKQLVEFPKLYNTENNTLIDFSTIAYKFIWRMCESYELWCKETKKTEDLNLKLID